ncbi:MAG: O-sialoglycoprotein endopeptidase [Limnochordales bacterium]|nr:O-sialoglycoprotein endopeptidase [Limnochordales bacterium]
MAAESCRVILGIDTSAYTTSLAFFSDEGRLLWEERQRLAVASGRLGLRQSEAVFQHLNVLPELLERACAYLRPFLGLVAQSGDGSADGLAKTVAGLPLPVVAVAASTQPRPRPDSYMPVFRVGERLGRAVAAFAGAPFFALSHQEGHLLAALYEIATASNGSFPTEFLLLHVSGGTTELLHVRRDPSTMRFHSVELGGSADLKAGQFVDRVALALNLPFPGGPHLEKLAEAAASDKLEEVADRSIRVRLSVAGSGLRISFSGPATQAERLIARGVPPEVVAAAAQDCLVGSLRELVMAGWAARPGLPLIVVGGVAANRALRRALQELAEARGLAVYFASPERSTDNAVGIAFGGWQLWKWGRKLTGV